ncbi:MAG: hypothetical protein QXP04_02810 [Candidatus Nanoarchaeia archaeon]|nr:hypothetical protein [Candidatus Jingweiarchaeum tengchongense]
MLMILGMILLIDIAMIVFLLALPRTRKAIKRIMMEEEMLWE